MQDARLKGLARRASGRGPDGSTLLLAGLALMLVVMASGSLMRMTLASQARGFGSHRGPAA